MGHVRLEQIAQVAYTNSGIVSESYSAAEWATLLNTLKWGQSTWRFTTSSDVLLRPDLSFVLFDLRVDWGRGSSELDPWRTARSRPTRAAMTCDDEPWFAAWKTWPCCCCSWGSAGVGGGWCWDAGTYGGDGVCMFGAGPGLGAIPSWRDRDGTVTSGAGTSGAGTGGGLATGGAAACAVMADSIASIRADMDEMTATNVCKVLPTLLAALMKLLIMVLEPADDSVVVVIVGARQHTEVVLVVLVATVVVTMPWLILPGISETFSTGEDIVMLHLVM